MKKKAVLILPLLCVFFLFGCDKAVNNGMLPSFSFDGSDNYTGFADLPANYTIEEAEADGYYVTEGVKAVANIDVWDSFMKKTMGNKNASIRMVSFFKENTDGPYIKDLFYMDELYYCFDSSAEDQVKHPYQYLLTLEGKFGNPLKDSVIIILTDDNTMTFDIVIQSALSSDLSFKKSISPYKLIMIR
ncbi:MAG: hypothetical protein GX154_11580 [Clostridiales bacterium]|nr:hypothetical protein [Clostridiales bacterium]